jgi:hypothetical protein
MVTFFPREGITTSERTFDLFKIEIQYRYCDADINVHWEREMIMIQNFVPEGDFSTGVPGTCNNNPIIITQYSAKEYSDTL